MRLAVSLLLVIMALALGCQETTSPAPQVVTATPNIPATVAALAQEPTDTPVSTPTPVPTPNIEATVEVRLAATVAARPTDTQFLHLHPNRPIHRRLRLPSLPRQHPRLALLPRPRRLPYPPLRPGQPILQDPPSRRHQQAHQGQRRPRFRQPSTTGHYFSLGRTTSR